MRKSKVHYYIRRTHRLLGVFLGIQFLLWTVGGLYFSWTKIEEIRGENLRKKPVLIAHSTPFVSPAVPLAHMKDDSIISIQIADILGKPYYQITIKTAEGKKTHLADALSGALRTPLSIDEAKEVARQSFTEKCSVIDAEYITSTDGHHEYREKPLPAYAVRMQHPSNTTVYVSTELGTVQSYRNDAWRIFDFLWMLHIMDFDTRDDMNNWLLRGFSVLGIVTLLSGFVLFFISSKWFTQKKLTQS